MVDIRAGRPGDVAALASLMFVEPAREVVALSGGPARAQLFQEALLRHNVEHAGSRLLVAEDDGVVVGYAELAGAEVPPLRVAAAIALRTLGPRRAVLAGWRSVARARVDLSPPAGGVHLAELQVHPRRRGHGIGGLLLDAVDAAARGDGAPHVSLTTTSVNPARRLYERHGYEVVRERMDARYERVTGAPGRVLMVKDLTRSASSR